MKRFFLLAVLFATGLTAMAQEKADEVIKVDAEKYDFGKIKQGVPVTTFFTITNTSNKPITIENSWAGCGCTTPEYSKEPIAPNSSSKLKVGYNAATIGHFTKDVNVKIAGFPQHKVIQITGEVVAANSFDGASNTETKKADEVKKTNDKTSKTDVKTKKS